MKLKFPALLLIPAAVLLAQTPAPKPAEAPAFTPVVPADKVVISVGDQKITAAQFNQLVDMLPEQSRVAARGANRQQFANDVVRVLVLYQEGKRRKLDENPAFQTQAQFQVENLLAARTYAALSAISDAELRQYYDGHKAEFIRVKARHILIRAKGSPIPLESGQKELTDEEALAKAQDLRKKIVGGADFATLAKQESDDAGSKGKGGQLDTFQKGQMVQPFEEAAFSLKVGDLSQPVRSPFGYHLIQVQERTEPTFEEAKTEIARRLQPEKSKEALDNLVKGSSVVIDQDFFAAPNAAKK